MVEVILVGHFKMFTKPIANFQLNSTKVHLGAKYESFEHRSKTGFKIKRPTSCLKLRLQLTCVPNK